MPNKEKVVIKKGYFPESIQNDENLKNEKFCFVSLDPDLYKPILEGLEFFLSQNGQKRSYHHR